MPNANPTVTLKLQPRQRAFFEADADEVLFGGAAGGGKSYAQLAETLADSIRWPGYRTLILRRTYPELEKSLIDVHLRLFPAAPWYRYNQSRHRGTFANGSVVDFGFLASEADKYRYQGAEYDRIRFDELTQFSESQYLYLLSRCRGTSRVPRSVKSSSNPGGPGHGWVKRRFIDPMPPDTDLAVTEELETPVGTVRRTLRRRYIPSRVQDNPALLQADPNYLSRLMHLPPTEREALLLGRWDLYEGRFFAEWDERLHVCAPRALPPEWQRVFAMDYGMDMLAAYWAAIDPEGDVWLYRELYEGRDNHKGEGGRGHIVAEAARRIREMTPETERIAEWLAPADLGSRSRDSGLTQSALFARGGVYLTLCRQSRADGWMNVREYLAPSPHADGTTRPRLHVFHTCRNLIRTLPALQYSPKDPRDIQDTDHELTHAPDALRLLCSHLCESRGAARPVSDPLAAFSPPKRRAGSGETAAGRGGRDAVV